MSGKGVGSRKRNSKHKVSKKMWAQHQTCRREGLAWRGGGAALWGDGGEEDGIRAGVSVSACGGGRTRFCHRGGGG